MSETIINIFSALKIFIWNLFNNELISQQHYQFSLKIQDGRQDKRRGPKIFHWVHPWIMSDGYIKYEINWPCGYRGVAITRMASGGGAGAGGGGDRGENIVSQKLRFGGYNK